MFSLADFNHALTEDSILEETRTCYGNVSLLRPAYCSGMVRAGAGAVWLANDISALRVMPQGVALQLDIMAINTTDLANHAVYDCDRSSKADMRAVSSISVII